MIGGFWIQGFRPNPPDLSGGSENQAANGEPASTAKPCRFLKRLSHPPVTSPHRLRPFDMGKDVKISM